MIPPSLEVMTEQFYDACAYLRDLDLSDAPGFFNIALTIELPTTAAVLYPETNEVKDATALIHIRITRYPDNTMHVHGPGVSAGIDMRLLEEKRP